jgi:hypothetical protein
MPNITASRAPALQINCRRKFQHRPVYGFTVSAYDPVVAGIYRSPRQDDPFGQSKS